MPVTSFPVGGAGVSVSVGDFNGDGKLDLAFANQNLNAVSVLLGDGKGGFGLKTDFPTGVNPFSIVTGDFNGDGKLDLAVANEADNTVSVLLGDGLGGFGAKTDFPLGHAPFSVALGDFNGDGKLDLAVASEGDNTVSVLLGDGLGGFGAKADFPTGSAPVSVAVGDLNGDGKLDLVVANYGDSVSVLIGDGTGHFGPKKEFAAGANPRGVAVADLNGDGKLDLAVANTSSNNVSVLLGDGLGGFAPKTDYLTGGYPMSVAVGDFDRDGKPDLAVATGGYGVVVLPGAGDGTFSLEPALAAGPGPSYVAVADLNGDLYPDLVVADPSAASVQVLMNAAAPVIVGVRDVPNDQGGHVFITWHYPVDALRGFVTGYRIWRRIPLLAAETSTSAASQSHSRPAMTASKRTRGSSLGETFWEAIADLPTARLVSYGYDAQTTQDSLHGSNPYTAFFVEALTGDPAVFVDSAPDSGYSVDNLAPPMPAPFTATYAFSQNALHWGTSPAPDLLEFQLYRGTNQLFVPGPSNLVIATRDTGYTDSPGSYFYKLGAVDIHGNVSLYALVTPSSPVGTLASVSSVEEAADHIKITWFSSNPDLAANVYRRTADGDWTALGAITADASGYLSFTDRGVTEGTRYGYRLGIMNGGVEAFAGETWATAEVLEFALDGARPNPAAHGQLTVQFSLPSAEPARIDLFDISGRRVAGREVSSTGPGRHVVDLAQGQRVSAGVYVVRLSQGKQVRTARAVVLN